MTYNKKSVEDIDVAGKRVLVRCDFNVPLKDGVITDENRINGALPTIQYLMSHGARVILCSHLGRPKGEFNMKYSLAPVAKRLSEKLGVEVPLAADVIGPDAKAKAAALKDGDVMLLENVRFHAEEEKNDSSGSIRFPLKVGDTVTVRRDIAERRDKRSWYIWSTVNGQKIKSPYITNGMVSMAGKAGKITSICSGESKYDIVYTLAFSNPTFDRLRWSINCLEEFHDYKAYVEGNIGKKKAPRKKSEERGEDYYGDSQEIIDDATGIKTDFFAYDYKGRKRVFPDIDGFITKIDVTIISGDETGLIYFVKDGKANRVAFDASVGTRFISYDDGTYTVEGKDNIKKWLSWSYDKDKAKNVNYAIQHMMDFLGGDK